MMEFFKILPGFYVAVAFVVFSPLFSHAQNTECRASCRGEGTVQVDLEQKCMCIDKTNCFKVSIGKDGPKMTTQGHGKLGKAEGKKYSTKSTTSSSYDNDAIDMGIPENTEVGKWIHKTNDCNSGGNNSTKGCIAVPCEHWKAVKEEMGEDIDICGGGAPASRGGSSGNGGGGSGGGNDRNGGQ